MRLDEKADVRWIRRTVSATVLVVLALYMTLWWVGRALWPIRELGMSVDCRRNVHMLARGFNLYADDYESQYMPATQWQLAIQPYVDARYRQCPKIERSRTNAWGYAMNRDASLVDRDRVERPEHLPLLFDSDLARRNAVDTLEHCPRPGRHIIQRRDARGHVRGNWVGYADGSARIRLEVGPQRAREGPVL